MLSMCECPKLSNPVPGALGLDRDVVAAFGALGPVRPIARHLAKPHRFIIIVQHSVKIGKHAKAKPNQSKADSRLCRRVRSKSNATTSTTQISGIRKTIDNQNWDTCRFSSITTQSPTNQSKTKNTSAPERVVPGICFNLNAIISA